MVERTSLRDLALMKLKEKEEEKERERHERASREFKRREEIRLKMLKAMEGEINHRLGLASNAEWQLVDDHPDVSDYAYVRLSRDDSVVLCIVPVPDHVKTSPQIHYWLRCLRRYGRKMASQSIR